MTTERPVLKRSDIGGWDWPDGSGPAVLHHYLPQCGIDFYMAIPHGQRVGTQTEHATPMEAAEEIGAEIILSGAIGTTAGGRKVVL